MAVLSGTQVSLELQPGLLRRYSTLRECVHHSVMNDPRGVKAVAADCDLSVSELSRRLSPSDGDPRSLDVDIFVRVMDSTKDLTPMHWLMARFLQDTDTRRRAAVEQLAQLMPHIATLLSDAGVTSAGKGKR